MADPRLIRPTWRGRTNVDALTISCVEKAERLGGHEFIVTQGSYQSSVEESAGTHDRGGAVDLAWCGHDTCVRALRRAGMAATWHRTPDQGPWNHHIHAVVYGHPDLSPTAARQIDSVLAGRNGLANNGPDDGPRLDPFPKAVWPPEGDDMFSDEDRAKLDTITGRLDKIAQAVLDVDEDLAKFRGNEWTRDKRIEKALKKQGVDLEQLRADLDADKP